jgi:hypothetical protein
MEYPHQKGGPLQAPPTGGNLTLPAPGSSGGGVMRIGRAFIIPAILALGVAGSALVGSAIPAAAANVPIVHVHPTGLQTGTNMYHHS